MEWVTLSVPSPTKPILPLYSKVSRNKQSIATKSDTTTLVYEYIFVLQTREYKIL